jgi:hypothetical protein
MTKSQLSRRARYQAGAVGVLVAFLIIHLFWPEITLDTVTLVLLLSILFLVVGPVLFKSMTLPWNLGAVEFQEDKDLETEAKAKVDEEIKQTNPQPSVNWGKSATLFWLGNDLMWIEDMTYRYAGPERVLEGVENALRYLTDLGFPSNSFPAQELTNAKIILQSLDGLSRENYRQVLQGHYQGIRKQVETVKFYIHSLATTQQPGFEKLRAFPK